MKLACVGDVGIDDYALAKQNVRRPGGIALNVAASARAGGLEVALVGAVGDDAEGDALLAALSPLGLDCSHLHRLPGATPRQEIRLAADGERRFAGYHPGVLTGWRLTADDLAFLAGCDAVFAPLADGLEAVFDAVARLPGPVRKAADFSIDSDLADGSDLDANVSRYAGAFAVCTIGGTPGHRPLAERLAAAHPEAAIVLTLGAEGAVAWRHGQRFAQPALPVPRVVDTTGCGDAFQGAFLAHFLAEGGVPAALRAGARRAAATLGRIGATALVLP
jgi:sugar/nucleoside kinase (ribokinase family)